MKKAIILIGLLYSLSAFSQQGNSNLDIVVSSFTDTLTGAVGEIESDIMGNLFVADFGEKVWKISPWGDVSIFSSSMYGASGNTLDLQGNLLQSQYYGNTIVKINRYTGEVSEIAHEGLAGPVGLTIHNKELYVCNCNGNFIATVKDQKVIEFSKDPLFNCPNGITPGPDGNLYVVNYRSADVVKIDKDGKASLFVKLPATSGGHIIFFNGHFYLTSFFDHKIFKVSPQGEITHIAGSGTLGTVDGIGLDAQFSFPNGIVAMKGALYVNDKIDDPNGGPHRTVIRKITLPNLNNLLTPAITNGDFEEAKKIYYEYKHHPLFKGDNTEVIINRMGYNMLSNKKIDMAINLFLLNTESYPNSFNAWDSLAESYMIKGDNKKAKEYYKQSLKLNPQNTNATEKLKEL